MDKKNFKQYSITCIHSFFYFSELFSSSDAHLCNCVTPVIQHSLRACILDTSIQWNCSHNLPDWSGGENRARMYSVCVCVCGLALIKTCCLHPQSCTVARAELGGEMRWDEMRWVESLLRARSDSGARAPPAAPWSRHGVKIRPWKKKGGGKHFHTHTPQLQPMHKKNLSRLEMRWSSGHGALAPPLLL